MEVRLYQDLIELNWNLLFSLITFLVLVLILKKFFFEKVHDFMIQREEGVQNRLDNAKLKEDEAEAKLKEYNDTLSNAEEESRVILREARENARRQADVIMDDARTEAESIVSDARRQADFEMEKAMHGMKEQVAELAIAAAEQILEKELETTGHEEIIDKVIAEAGSEKWQN